MNYLHAHVFALITFNLFKPTAICIPACSHGSCSSPGKCTCLPDWTGDICDNGKTHMENILS